MSKIIDYLLISRKTLSELMQTVNEFINLGWQPFGAAFYDNCTEYDGAWPHQTMVKYEQNN